MSYRTELSEEIMPYFRFKNIFVLHVFICDERDNLHLRKAENFSNFLSVIFCKREIQWDSIRKTNAGWFIDTSCYFNRNLLRQ
ncbi:Ionotropic receptor 75j, partial [Halyomorpha halys]